MAKKKSPHLISKTFFIKKQEVFFFKIGAFPVNQLCNYVVNGNSATVAV